MNDLTDRETEVLALVAQGLSNKAISGALGISDHTTKFHIANIARKLGVHRRTEIAVRALKEGMV